MAILSIGELLGVGDEALSGYVPYSAISGVDSVISSINGSGLSAGLDSATVSAIASSYAESAASGKLDNSASSSFYPMEGNPSGFLTSVDLTDYATTEYVDSSLSSKVDQSAFDDCCSSVESALSGKLDNSASSSFYPMEGNPSGFLTGVDLSDYATLEYVDSGLSGKEDKLTWRYKTSGGVSYITSVNNSAFSSSPGIPTSLLIAEEGLAINVSGGTAYLSLDTKGTSSLSSITAIGGSSIRSNPLSLVSSNIQSYETASEISDLGYTRFVGDTSNRVGVFSRECMSAFSTGSASSNHHSTASGFHVTNCNITDLPTGNWGPVYIPSWGPSTPSVSYPTSVKVTSRSYTSNITYDTAIGTDKVWVVRIISDDGYAGYAEGAWEYHYGDQLPKGYGLVRLTQYHLADLSSFDAATTSDESWYLRVLRYSGPIAYSPITGVGAGWLQVNGNRFGVGPTASYYGTVDSFSTVNSFVASASARELEIYSMGVTGSVPTQINWTGIVSSPYGSKWYLVEKYSSTVDSSTGSAVIAMDYVPSGSGIAKLNAMTRAYGNSVVCYDVKLSAVFDETPNDETVQINEQYGESHKLTVGTVLGNQLY